MMKNILKQIKRRRKAKGLKQNDIASVTGVSRQQYQRLESKGNPSLASLERIAKALHATVALVPNDKLHLVAKHIDYYDPADDRPLTDEEHAELLRNPWQGLLGDEDDE